MRVAGGIIATTLFAMYLFSIHARIISAQSPPNKFEGATHYFINPLVWIPALTPFVIPAKTGIHKK